VLAARAIGAQKALDQFGFGQGNGGADDQHGRSLTGARAAGG
jgi:hypothetical protein